MGNCTNVLGWPCLHVHAKHGHAHARTHAHAHARTHTPTHSHVHVHPCACATPTLRVHVPAYCCLGITHSRPDGLRRRQESTAPRLVERCIPRPVGRRKPPARLRVVEAVDHRDGDEPSRGKVLARCRHFIRRGEPCRTQARAGSTSREHEQGAVTMGRHREQC